MSSKLDILGLRIHIIKYYQNVGKGRGFCLKHNISYNSLRAIFVGKKKYPGIEEIILKAMQEDLKHFNFHNQTIA